MDANNNSPTQSEDKAVQEPAQDSSLKVSSVDGQNGVKIEQNICAMDTTSSNVASHVSGDSAEQPASPKTSVAPRRFHFNRKDETEFHYYISKAHTCLRQGHPTAADDKDKDILKLSEMVSQMTHLLAASGVGRDTTARALAYTAGPDKPTPKEALIEAKRDRRKKNDARRVASGGSDKSAKAGDGDNVSSVNDAASRLTLPTSESTNPPNSLEDGATTSGKSINTRNENSSSTITQATETTNDQGEGKKNSKKSFGRRRWWPRRNRRSNNNQGKGKENAGDSAEANGTGENAPIADRFEHKDRAADADKENPLGATTNAAATAA